jgi:hypothetical protein
MVAARWAAAQTASAVRTENSTMVSNPNGPSGQGGSAPGRPAVNLATPATPAAKRPATPIRAVASNGVSPDAVTEPLTITVTKGKGR